MNQVKVFLVNVLYFLKDLLTLLGLLLIYTLVAFSIVGGIVFLSHFLFDDTYSQEIFQCVCYIGVVLFGYAELGKAWSESSRRKW